MRICYIAKHDQTDSNDDEGAIAHALAALGHDVTRIHEANGDVAAVNEGWDFVLFHKWDDPGALTRIAAPKVFWYFDLVDFPDPTIAKRCRQRVDWMRRIVPLVDLGFCTDGDWVSRDRTGKLAWLAQGADERVVGRGAEVELDIPILFTGIRYGGQLRRSFVDEMRERWGSAFHHVESGVHGRAMADLVARAKIVVAPDGPVTQRYWSNRVYNALGFGAYLLHPLCAGLVEQYPGVESYMYPSRPMLHGMLETALDGKWDGWRDSVSGHFMSLTISHHLYRHRCEELVRTVKERLKI